MAHIFQSLIQGDFGGDHKNFEAIVLVDSTLQHFWRDNSTPGNPWNPGQRFADNRAVFPASLIQSSLGDGHHGNFEVVAPLKGENGVVELWHLWHDNSDVSKPWSFGQRITERGRRVTGPASIIQSDFGGDHGNFEVIVPVLADSGRTELWHYWHDNSNVELPWRRGGRVSDPSHQVVGSGCLIQSNFGSGDHGNFEVTAWVKLPDGQSVLQHYWHDNSDVNSPWQLGQVIAFGVKGNGVIIQSSFGDGDHGNFEVVVPVEGPEGRTYLQHLWHDNSDVNLPWRRGQVPSEVVSTDGAACLIESDYRSGDHGNFELIVDECQSSLIGYWHPNEDVRLPWLRNGMLLREPPAGTITNTQRVCQLTGENDRTGWPGSGPITPAFNRTESRYGIRGTDLGVSFEHRNRIYFLFGDTWRTSERQSTHFDWDSIAICTDTSVQGGLHLTFYKDPPLLPGIPQGAFEVPLDGFSFRDQMFVFFSADHRSLGSSELMGRSVLGVSDNDGYDFIPLLTFSRAKFVNVSVERAKLDATQAVSVGWPEGTEVLWVFGSGRYRSSPVYLAVIALDRLVDAVFSRRDRPVELGSMNDRQGPVFFLSGNRSGARWSSNENDAVPLFCAGDVGELSCRMNTVFGRRFLTYNTGNPRGIVLRHSVQPWGPWSDAKVIFDPGWGFGPGNFEGAGYGNFMHVGWDIAKVDHVQDDAFLAGMRDNDWGGEYGPFQITRFSTGKANEYCDLHYTMSTWNPYQAVLMRTRVTARDLGIIGSDTATLESGAAKFGTTLPQGRLHTHL